MMIIPHAKSSTLSGRAYSHPTTKTSQRACLADAVKDDSNKARNANTQYT